MVRKDLESHPFTCPLEPVPYPFRGLGCKTTVCRKDLDKHIETSTPQHMTVLAESYTALQAQHTVQHTALQAEHARSENKLKAIESVLSGHQRAQIYTILMESSLSIGKSLALAIPDKPGHHHIILSQESPKPHHKFKLEWEPASVSPIPFARLRKIAALKFQFHLITEAAYPKMTTETEFDISFNSHHAVQVCCGKLQAETQEEDNYQQLIKTFTLQFLLPRHKQMTIKFSPHNSRYCSCQCHPLTTCYYCEKKYRTGSRHFFPQRQNHHEYL